MQQSVLLLLLSWLTMFGISQEMSRKTENSWPIRVSFLFATVAWGSVLVVITEVLSLFKLLQYDALLIAWSIALLVGGAIYLYLRQHRMGSRSLLTGGRDLFHRELKFTSILSFAMIIVIFSQILLLAIVAYQYTPNNWDSMTYHLARVMYWQQDHSVAHFATLNERQIQQPPFSEFVLTHLQIMLKGDQLANLVQWFAMIVSLLGVSYIAERLGADKTRQIIAALLTVSIPMGILQATSTQNDYVVTAWLVCFVAFGLSLMAEPENKEWAIGTGLALGLALLTKSTTFIYALPFCICIALYLLKKQRFRAVRIGFIILLFMLSVNLGHFTRNTQLYGSPTGARDLYSNEFFSVRVLASNMIRNVALHLTPSDLFVVGPTSYYALRGLSFLHEFTGLSPTDSRTTWGRGGQSNIFLVAALSYDEDYSGNPVHVGLIMLTLALIMVRIIKKDRINMVSIFYITSLFFSFFIFCFYLKWQIWNSRLHLPLFVLWTPVISTYLLQNVNMGSSFFYLLIALSSFNWTFKNVTRPIDLKPYHASESRASAHFSKRPELLPIYSEMTSMIIESQCSKIGVMLGEDGWEYPFWTLFQEKQFPVEMRHLMVHNPSQVYTLQNYQPCAVISARSIADKDQRFIDSAWGDYHLYIEKNWLDHQTEQPAGFSVSPDLGVLLESGWYGHEPELNIRWTQSPSRFQIYAFEETNAKLVITPFGMNVEGEFGSEGELNISLNGTPVDTITITAGKPNEVFFPLQAGFNRVQFELLAGNVKLESDPRTLSVAFFPIEIVSLPSEP